MRTAFLASLATAAISMLVLPLPAQACSYAFPLSPPSSYEAVDEAPRIVLARATGSSADPVGNRIHFRIEEVLKGEPAGPEEVVTLYGGWKDPWELMGCACGPPCQYSRDGAHLLFLERGDDDGWTLARLQALVNQEVKPEDDWVRTVRLYAGISALNDPVREREALLDLRARVEAEEESYPKGLKDQLARHFLIPSPYKSFSELMDLYAAAESGDQREAVLWALVHGSHPETSAFFRRLLFSGEPDWLLEPAMEWFSSKGQADMPRIEELAQAYQSYPPGERQPLLALVQKAAEPEHAPLLWSLLPGSSPEEIQETLDWIVFKSWAYSRLPLFAQLYGKSDERLRREVVRTWIRSSYTAEKRLRQLLIQAEKTSKPGPRKELVQALLRARAADSQVLWQRLRKAEAWEADLLVEWFAVHPLQTFESKLSHYRSARTEEEKDRALWVAAVGRLEGEANYDYLGRLLAAAGDLGDGPRRLHRLGRAFRSCPNVDGRLRMAGQIGITMGVAQAEDFPVVLEMLRGSTLREARTLAGWFIRHPSPEVIPDFRERLGAIHEDHWIPVALAAAGDPEILDWALNDLRRPESDHRVLSTTILSHSPLPAAAGQIRQMLAEGNDSLDLLMLGFVGLNNRSPYRWWFFEEILKSGEHRPTAIGYLQQLAEEGDETAKRLLSESGS